MAEHRWTRRPTWPTDPQPSARDHWSVYRDGVFVGRVYPYHLTDGSWYWCTFTDPGGSGTAADMAAALEAVRQTAGDQPLMPEYGPDPPGRRGLTPDARRGF